MFATEQSCWSAGGKMADKAWDGSVGSFFDGQRWNPSEVPQAGDTAVIRAGTVRVGFADISNVAVDLGSDQPAGEPMLAASFASLGRIDIHAPPPQSPGPTYPARYGEIDASGVVIDKGPLNVGTTDILAAGIPGDLTLRLSPLTAFDLTGGATVMARSSLTVTGDKYSAFFNNGTVTDIGGTLDFAAPVLGSGKINVEMGRFIAATATFEDAVSSGQSVLVSPTSTVNIDKPLQFLGSITEDPFGSVVLRDTPSNSSSYDHGVLTVFDYGRVVASLHINSGSDLGFTVAQNGSDTIITTPPSGPAAAMQLAQSTMAVPVLAPNS